MGLLGWCDMPCAYVVWINQFYLLMHDIWWWLINTCALYIYTYMHVCTHTYLCMQHTYTHIHTSHRHTDTLQVSDFLLVFSSFVCRNKMVASHTLRSVIRTPRHC